MIINHNLASNNAISRMNANSASASNSMQKLSSGLRINKAGDDAAGLAISEKMRGQIRGLDQASANAQDGISMIQTAEGALNETHSILQRIRELADQSANGTNTDADRKSIQDEVSQLKSEIDRIGNTTEFNTQKLLNGSLKTSGAAVGQDTTTGIDVAKLTSASVTATSAMNSSTALVGDSDFVQGKLTIDGSEITVNWQNLSEAEKTTIKAGTGSGATTTSMNAAKDLIVSKINEAIDQSGAKVAHVSGYVDSANKLVIESGSTGTTSAIKSSAATGISGKFLGTAGTTGDTGDSTYNGSNVATTDKINFKIGDVNLQASITTAISAGDTMSSAATQLQHDINDAISSYNTAAGATSSDKPGYIADVKVNATNDGRFEIVSESGPISLSDLAGKTAVKDLGLTQAQTESGGNGGMTFQIGANRGQTITFGINDMRSAALGISGVDVSTKAGAQSALDTLDKAIASVSSERGKLGAIQNRLEHTINNLGTSSENLTSAESRIRDVDMAKEMSTFSKNNILSQAAQAMLAQANQQPQQVLQLLR
ncbi:flagellin [Candidatus Clostridium helianthi]|uniref:Flagellin n=1 Tax=Candidatus Clostridium helianthi TaxID=3381660 RepID=A0ABW8S536_9CLOT